MSGLERDHTLLTAGDVERERLADQRMLFATRYNRFETAFSAHGLRLGREVAEAAEG